ncbi:phage tail protein [Escherichia coli]|uniref:phage tail protein n=1 Tax=Escherichia coli TaxID=562 RepID=UPI000AF9A16C|nr:phage tail protein [Escherichia coli]
MTAKYFAILTNQGAARLANAAALGTKLNLTQMAVGDANGTLPTPDPAQTKLINQKRIAQLNLLTVDPANASQIIAEQIIPENEGGFWIREIGLYDDDGILIAVANCPETYKPQLQEGSGRTQTIRMILIVSSTAAVTLKIDPSVVLATRKYVDDKVIEVKLYADEVMKSHMKEANPHRQYLQATMLLKELADLGYDSVRAALENIGLDRIVQDTNETRLLAPGKKQYIFASPASWGLYSTEPGSVGFIPLGVTAGGTGAGDDAGARKNLKLDRIAQDTNETRITAPGKRTYIFVNDTGWGAYNLDDATSVPLSMAAGGTGAKDAAGARQKLELGDSATRNVGTGADDVAAGNDSRITGAMQKGKNGGDIQDVAAFRGNLQLKAAALRDVGTGADQIPDMSAYTSGPGWVRFPDGTIVQKGTSISGPLQYPTAIQFPIPFTQEFRVTTTFDSAKYGVVDCPTFAVSPIGLGGFYLMSSRPPVDGGTGAGAHWIAIGK